MKKLVAPVVLLVVTSATALTAYRASCGKPGPAPAGTSPTSAPHVPVRIAAEGRVAAYPGAEVVVGTDFAGTVTRLLVSEKQAVKKGALIAELNADEQKAQLTEARAQIAEAEADMRLTAYDVSRAEHLLATKVGSQQALDKARRDDEAAKARRATAAARAERLAAVIAKSRLLAPIDGVILARHVEAGETVDRGARVVTIADLSRVRVEAEVDESDSGRVALGAEVTVRAEGDDGHQWRGRVEEIPDAVTVRKLKPEDPGKPSDTRILLVKIALEEPAALKLGRRVEVEIGEKERG